MSFNTIYMAVLRITKEFRYEGAHALPGYDGKCRNIHGHSYVLYVTVKGETRTNGEGDPAKEGMIVDFKVLKGIVEENIIDVLDHALLLRRGTPLANELAQEYPNIILVDFQPTSENMITWFAEILKEKLPAEIELFSLRLYETATSYAEWFASDNI